MKRPKFTKLYFSSEGKSGEGHPNTGKVIIDKTKKCERWRCNNTIWPGGGHLHFLSKSPETCDRNPGSRDLARPVRPTLVMCKDDRADSHPR